MTMTLGLRMGIVSGKMEYVMYDGEPTPFYIGTTVDDVISLINRTRGVK